MKTFVKIAQSPAILDSSNATQFHREIESLIESGVKIVLLDLKNVTFISNSGLMALISIFRSVKSAGCKLGIKSCSEPVRILLELTSLDRVFEFLPDFKSPLEDFKEGIPQPDSTIIEAPVVKRSAESGFKVFS